APDLSGPIFWYRLEGTDQGLAGLWLINTHQIVPKLNTVPGVADVIVPGSPPEFRIEVDPMALRTRGVALGDLDAAVRRAKSAHDKKEIENIVIKETDGAAILVRNVAHVALVGKEDSDRASGVVMLRCGENAAVVTKRVKDTIAKLQSGLP